MFRCRGFHFLSPSLLSLLPVYRYALSLGHFPAWCRTPSPPLRQRLQFGYRCGNVGRSYLFPALGKDHIGPRHTLPHLEDIWQLGNAVSHLSHLSPFVGTCIPFSERSHTTRDKALALYPAQVSYHDCRQAFPLRLSLFFVLCTSEFRLISPLWMA